MDIGSFGSLPDEAQLWVFGFGQVLSRKDQASIAETLERFLPHWASHQMPVSGAYTILYDRFVIVAGFRPDGLSGCSMDSCVANFKQLQQKGLDGLAWDLVFYRDSCGCVQSLDRDAFQKAVDSGEVTKASRVFDTSLQKLGQLRRGDFETTFDRCWHSRAFAPTAG